jgi:hypothetical protein
MWAQTGHYHKKKSHYELQSVYASRRTGSPAYVSTVGYVNERTVTFPSDMNQASNTTILNYLDLRLLFHSGSARSGSQWETPICIPLPINSSSSSSYGLYSYRLDPIRSPPRLSQGRHSSHICSVLPYSFSFLLFSFSTERCG